MINRFRWIGYFGLTFLLIFLLSLAQKTETVDGVRLIHNEKPGKWNGVPRVSLKFIKTIGDIESEDENVLFYMPSDIAFDSQGNIYVLDSGNHRIQKFGPDGKYMATIGNRGQGPAEFQFPISLDIDAEEYMYIADQGNQRIQIINPDGTNHKTIKIIKEKVGITRVSGKDQMIMGGGGIVLMSPGAPEEDQEPPKLIKFLDMEGSVQKEIGSPYDYKNFLLNRTGNIFHFTVDSRNNVYVVFDYQNRIEKYSSEGQLLWRSDRELNYSTEPKSKGILKRSGGMVTIQQPDMNRCSSGIAVDDKGRIWVVTLKRQIKEDEEVQTSVRASMDAAGDRSLALSVSGNTDVRETDIYQLEVYDPDGVLLGTIPLNHFVDDIRIDKDRIFLLDKMRGMQFYEYKIIEE
jgi:hypothetical protein